MKDIIALIDGKNKDFSKGQKKIAEFVINNAKIAAYLTAGKLAGRIGVSESTIIRFAHELGYDGYPALQKDIREFTKNRLTPAERMELAEAAAKGGDILETRLKADIGFIEKTLDNIDREQFERAAAAIASANKIYITGVRSAAALAEFAGFYLRLIIDNVRIIKSTGGDDLFEQILNVGKGDVFIGISFPRYSKNTVKALEYAKKNGAEVIGITDSKSSPVAQESTCCLIAENDAASFADSLTAPFSLINALIVAVGMHSRERVQENLEKLEQIWDEYEVYDKK